MATRAIKCVVVGDENGGDSEKECKNTKHKYYMNKHEKLSNTYWLNVCLLTRDR